MARLAFVAEAPAGEEVDAGRSLGQPPIPLVGPSGRIFSHILRAAGLARVDNPPLDWGRQYGPLGLRPLLWERSDHWVGNVWDTRIEGDDFGSLFAPATEAREGGYGEAAYHAPQYGWLRPEHRGAFRRLAQDLTAFRPTAIVTLGAAATWVFTEEAAIAETAGSRMTATRILPGLPVYPTLHPAHVIADFRMLERVIADVKRAARGDKPQPRTLWVAPDISGMERWWREHGAKAPYLAVDIETVRGQIDVIAFSSPSATISVPFVDFGSSSRSYWAEADEELRAWDMVEEWLMSPCPKIFQNGLYDLAWLWGEMGLRVKNYCRDTRLMQHVHDPEMPKSLAYMGATYTMPPPAWKLMRTGEEKRDA